MDKRWRGVYSASRYLLVKLATLELVSINLSVNYITLQPIQLLFDNFVNLSIQTLN